VYEDGREFLQGLKRCRASGVDVLHPAPENTLGKIAIGTELKDKVALHGKARIAERPREVVKERLSSGKTGPAG